MEKPTAPVMGSILSARERRCVRVCKIFLVLERALEKILEDPRD